jgi:branched-chain amino acid transport system ATP-binding protein
LILEIKGLTRFFQRLTAVNDLSFAVEQGTIKALIGPNGAGKTTTFNMVTGLLTPSRGSVFFKGEELTRRPPHVRAKKGLSRTFQIVRPFAEMTVLENVMVGCDMRTGSGLFSAAFRLPRSLKDERKVRHKAMEELQFVGLAARANAPATSLPMGEQRVMEIARALASDPEIVLFDEPAAGLNEKETDQLAKNLLRIKERGITILLVEHDMRLVMRVSDEVVVINYGSLIAEGTPSEIRNNPEVITAYLGK